MAEKPLAVAQELAEREKANKPAEKAVPKAASGKK